ncbi:MAG: iron ABC transporter permease [candidate division WS1 bacterium]|jgi:iron complex transport system permease protein|nr:iron ABC transporter permease [candidate division WS1 bacterium]
MKRSGLVWLSLALLLIVAAVLSLSLGAAPIDPMDVALALLSRLPGLSGLDPGLTSGQHVVIFELRLPRLALALLVGAALSVAGVVMQAFFQNPMAAPSIIGISSGASFGATVAVVSGAGIGVAGLGAVPVAAFAGALLATAVVYLLSRRGGSTPVGVLLLTGVAMGSLMSALAALVLITGQDPTRRDLDQVVYWMLGSVAGRTWTHVLVVLPYVAIAGGFTWAFGRDLNVLSLGDDTAHYLGLNVEQVRLMLLALSSLLTAAAVAVSGVVGFVGLVVPHLMRIIVGPDHRTLLPASALAGAALVVLADVVARTVAAPTEIPVGIITSLLGAPFFLYLLHRRREYAI